ncbi:putative thioesterase domain containing protein [Phaeoacremonium minimum UCRPA7]|uniref:Putative thioesterase domain containing protein n=1 Tax=Phaeoacremonium minimum (strain UCR-PA7) TaxID=1286976 RepID=R8BV17_PHAM7|nr:putative thioesterase domain containing protein [Phaeoacremonium minimum UCRPA7]EOO03203.1 putative thioesterase domain containing protein [Phaeoacremonium minimum UCRPA7]
MAVPKVTVQQIQWRPRLGRAPAPPPLFLIHDSSGLLFNYHLLDDLKRDVYGIADPLFGTEERWHGGIPEMAREYVSAIQATVGKGPIVIGGWSLGGMISIEMARVIRRSLSTTTDVRGLILIDTPNTQGWKALRSELDPFDLDLSKASPRVQQGVKRRFELAEDLVYDWEFPGPSDLPTDYSVAESSKYFFGKGERSRLAALKTDKELALSLRLQQERCLLPPALLVRATDLVKPDAESRARVDLSRDQRMLGWEDHPVGFIRAVQDTSGHHYDLFEGGDRLIAVSQAINGWCSILDEAWSSRSKGVMLNPAKTGVAEKKNIMMEKKLTAVVQEVPAFWI